MMWDDDTRQHMPRAAWASAGLLHASPFVSEEAS